MDWLAYEELESEWNARYDYISELAYEHRDWAEEAYHEDGDLIWEDYGQDHNAHVVAYRLHTDDIPF